MRVKELVDLLKTHCNPYDVVVLQCDPEGNGYGHLGGVFPIGESGFEMKDQQEDFDVAVDDCVILMPFTTVWE